MGGFVRFGTVLTQYVYFYITLLHLYMVRPPSPPPLKKKVAILATFFLFIYAIHDLYTDFCCV